MRYIGCIGYKGYEEGKLNPSRPPNATRNVWVLCAGDNQQSNEIAQEIKANQLIQDPYGASLELWQIEEMTTRGIVGTVRDIWGKHQGQPEWCQVPSVNEQWTQHVSPPRRFICIGAREVVILHRLQPWEKLRELGKELEVRRGPPFEPDDLSLTPEQKCASLLLWWVRAGGSPGGAKGSRLTQADHASHLLFRLADQDNRVSAAETACGRVRAVVGWHSLALSSTWAGGLFGGF